MHQDGCALMPADAHHVLREQSTISMQATSVGDLLYVSGQIPLLPGTTKFSAADIEGQTDQVLKNLGAILKKAGSSFDQVLKTTVLLHDMADFQKMNGVYGTALSLSLIAHLPSSAACKLHCWQERRCIQSHMMLSVWDIAD